MWLYAYLYYIYPNKSSCCYHYVCYSSAFLIWLDIMLQCCRYIKLWWWSSLVDYTLNIYCSLLEYFSEASDQVVSKTNINILLYIHPNSMLFHLGKFDIYIYTVSSIIELDLQHILFLSSYFSHNMHRILCWNTANYLYGDNFEFQLSRWSDWISTNCLLIRPWEGSLHPGPLYWDMKLQYFCFYDI